MAEQNFKNHSRYYVPHHFVFYPVALAVLTFCLAEAYREPAYRKLWIIASVLTGLITWLSFMVRQHYAMTLQNRLVILELRYRYFTLTGQRLEEAGKGLSSSQLFALRFAGDDELPALVMRAAEEKMPPAEIKKAVKSWKADYNRV